MDRTAHATNKTFTQAGRTHDTFEPFIETIGYELHRVRVYRGKTWAVRTKTISVQYVEDLVDTPARNEDKRAALAEAEARCKALNAAWAAA